MKCKKEIILPFRKLLCLVNHFISITSKINFIIFFRLVGDQLVLRVYNVHRFFYVLLILSIQFLYFYYFYLIILMKLLFVKENLMLKQIHKYFSIFSFILIKRIIIIFFLIRQQLNQQQQHLQVKILQGHLGSHFNLEQLCQSIQNAVIYLLLISYLTFFIVLLLLLV